MQNIRDELLQRREARLEKEAENIHNLKHMVELERAQVDNIKAQLQILREEITEELHTLRAKKAELQSLEAVTSRLTDLFHQQKNTHSQLQAEITERAKDNKRTFTGAFTPERTTPTRQRRRKGSRDARPRLRSLELDGNPNSPLPMIPDPPDAGGVADPPRSLTDPSPATERLYSLVSLPSQWTSDQDKRFRERLVVTTKDATEDRYLPENCMNTLAAAPASGKRFRGRSCWQRCLTRDGTEKQNKDPKKACGFCSAAGVDCVYFEFVDGIVTSQKIWMNGRPAKHDGAEVKEVGGKRWRLLYRSN